jgi:hypothetical protein
MPENQRKERKRESKREGVCMYAYEGRERMRERERGFKMTN